MRKRSEASISSSMKPDLDSTNSTVHSEQKVSDSTTQTPHIKKPRIDTQKREDERKYCFEEENGINGYSFLVLNKEGVVLIAGRKAFKDSPEDDNFLVTKAGNALSEDNSTHAYIVMKGVRHLAPNQTENIQFVLIRSFIGKDSAHPGIFQAVLTRKFKTEICQKYQITLENDYYFSGECQSKLKISEMRTMLGKPLRGIIFNTKGSKTDQFKSNIFSPVLVTYIPASCITQHKIYDQLLCLDSPEKRQLDAQKEPLCSLFFNSPEREKITTSEPSDTDSMNSGTHKTIA